MRISLEQPKTIFKNAYPERHFNVRDAETEPDGHGCWSGNRRKIPFASTFAIFGAGRAYEIIRNSICYPKLNVKIALLQPFRHLSWRRWRFARQSIEDIALMRVIPNMTVLSPADAIETEK